MKSKRTKWCNVAPPTRNAILVRDGNKCILCGSSSYLTMAHIFVSRAKGGKGSKDNIVTLCKNCHFYHLDNPIGEKNVLQAKVNMEKCKQYLIKKENITNVDVLKERLTYKKGL